MLQRCVRCGSFAASKDHILCSRCRCIEKQRQEMVQKEVRHFEKHKFGQSFEEFFLSHLKNCPNCQGNKALAVYCFWKEDNTL